MRTYLLWCHTFNVQWTLFIQKWDFLFKREFFVAIGDLYSNDNIRLTFFVDNLLLTKYLLTNLLLMMGVASMSELVESESPRPHYSKTGLGDLAIKLTNKNKHLKHDCMIMLISRWNSQLRRNIKIFNWTPLLTLSCILDQIILNCIDLLTLESGSLWPIPGQSEMSVWTGVR